MFKIELECDVADVVDDEPEFRLLLAFVPELWLLLLLLLLLLPFTMHPLFECPIEIAFSNDSDKRGVV